jgi:hypothetical protein
MKLISTVYKDRKIHLPDATNTYFDKDGICELSIDQAQAEYLCKNILNLKIYEDGDLIEDKKEEVISGAAEPTNIEALQENQEAMKVDSDNTTHEQEKSDAITKINKIKSLKKLKELAADFDKSEWESFTTIEQMKQYLISKV